MLCCVDVMYGRFSYRQFDVYHFQFDLNGTKCFRNAEFCENIFQLF